MLNMPIIKFEKSVNYLTKQLETQENNKQLILDITAKIQLMSNSYANNKKLNELLDTSNALLQDLSTNITLIEQSELEISNITNELSNLLSDKNRTSKTKEYYIIAFSNIKNSIVTYTNSFIELQKKLDTDNKALDDFISANNLKYNFTTVTNNSDNVEDSYKYTGFTINNSETSIDDIPNEESNTEIINTEKMSDIDNSSEPFNEYKNENEDMNESISIEDLFLLEDLSNEINSQNNNVDNSINSNEIKDEVITNDMDEISSADLDEIISADDISSADLDEIISADDISSADLDEIISADDISSADLDEIISANDISSADLDEIISSDDISQLEKLSQNNSNNSVEADESSYNRTHYSYVELKNELNRIFNEINNTKKVDDFENKVDVDTESAEIIDNESSLDSLLIDNVNKIVSKDEDVISNTLAEDDIDLLDDILDINTEYDDIFDTSDNENASNNSDSDISISDALNNLAYEEYIDSETPEIVDSTDDDTNDINLSETSFIDNSLKFKETLSNNNFSLVEEGIYNEYSAFTAPPSSSDIDISEPSIDLSNTIINNENVEEKIINHTDIFSNDEITDIDITNNTLINSITDTNNLDDIIIDDNIINDNITTADNIETTSDDNISDSNNSLSETMSPEDLSIIEEENNSDIIQNINNKIEEIISAKADNSSLIISERTKYIYLPYRIDELINYIENYPNVYSSLSDVVKQEFVLKFDYFISHPIKSRFEETYNLMKNREHKSSIESLKFAVKLSKMDNLNPAIIAACKTEYDLNNYLYHLNSNSLNKFKLFDIIYDINPL